MPDTVLYTREAAARKAAIIIPTLNGTKLRLFKSGLTLSAFTTRIDLFLAECDFTGYAPGGYPLATWSGPAPAPTGGAIITSPLVNIVCNANGSGDVINEVGGWWIEDSTGTVRLAGAFSPVRLMDSYGATINWITQIIEAYNLPTG